MQKKYLMYTLFVLVFLSACSVLKSKKVEKTEAQKTENEKITNTLKPKVDSSRILKEERIRKAPRILENK